MNKHEYVEKMPRVLNDETKFKLLGNVVHYDRTAALERKLQTCLLQLCKSKELPHDVYERMRPHGSQRPRMYG